MDPTARKNTCIGIPHDFIAYPLDDPVFQHAFKRVKVFIRSTFWANSAAWNCHQAALAIAKRGLNIDEVFFYWGPGGVGLTLTTELLEAQFGIDSHKSFDPYMLHLAEEMRKQIECISNAFVWTACEKPEGLKKPFREDLFKKVASADAVFGRLPYQIITKVIKMVGWKRMELNKLLSFGNISEAAFHAIFRRCCIIKMRGRFVDSAFIDNHMTDASKFGFFKRDHDLKEFLGSKPAAAAANRLQALFEMKHDLSQCRQFIVDYRLNGGDGGITLQFIRQACNLPPMSTEVSADGVELPPGINLEDDAMEVPSVGMDAELRHCVLKFMLDEGRDVITRVHFKFVKNLPKSCESMRRDVLWQRLKNSTGWVEHIDGKMKDGLRPVLATSTQYKAIVPEPIDPPFTTLPEMYDVFDLKSYADSKAFRKDNALTMIDALSNCRGKKARGVLGVNDIATSLEKRANKLRHMEDYLLFF